MANPKPLLKGIVELLSKPKVAAPASAAIYALAPDDVEGSGLLQALKAAKIARQRLADELAARFSDAPGSSIPQRRAEKQLAEMDRQIEMLQKQLEEADPAPAWGATPGAVRIQDMMDRYGDVKGGMGTPPAQMQQRMGMEQLELPLKDPQAGYGTPPRTSQAEYEAWYKQKAADRAYEAQKRREEMRELYEGDALRERLGKAYDWD
jgi:hypothetical protein